MENQSEDEPPVTASPSACYTGIGKYELFNCASFVNLIYFHFYYCGMTIFF